MLIIASIQDWLTALRYIDQQEVFNAFPNQNVQTYAIVYVKNIQDGPSTCDSCEVLITSTYVVQTNGIT